MTWMRLQTLQDCRSLPFSFLASKKPTAETGKPESKIKVPIPCHSPKSSAKSNPNYVEIENKDLGIILV